MTLAGTVPAETIPLRVLSLGAGVQSTTLALMSARGDLPRLDGAIFADTGSEPAAVYLHLDWLETQLPFPVYRVSRPGPSLARLAIDVATKPIKRTASPPWYTKAPNGMLPRQCSSEFKRDVIARKVRDLLGLGPRQRAPKGKLVEQWLGISRDEMQRMKDARQAFVSNVFPLIGLGFNRRDCLRWLAERQYPRPPKSACIFCPYHTGEQWRDMRDNAPEDWAAACAFDEAIRPGFFGMEGQAFVHRQMVPLAEADLSRSPPGQTEFGFVEECEGICGT